MAACMVEYSDGTLRTSDGRAATETESTSATGWHSSGPLRKLDQLCVVALQLRLQGGVQGKGQ